MSKIKLPYLRFVRQVSNGSARSKYSYLAMMRDNAAALEAASWSPAKSASPQLTVNQLTRTDGEVDGESGAYTRAPTFTAYLNDAYDCYTQAGDAVPRMATMCGYAGIAAYRFTLPTVNPGAITEMAVCIQRDRYLRSGVRVAVELSNSAEPSVDWSVIRGDSTGAIVSTHAAPDNPDGCESFGFLGQPDAPYLLAGRAADAVLTFKAADFAALLDASDYTYLYIYISPEDLAGVWTWYSKEDPRAYYIEGSAMLVPSGIEFTFATAAVAPSSELSCELVRGGVVPTFESTPVLSPVFQCTVTKNGDTLGYNSIKQLAATVVGSGGTVKGVRVCGRHLTRSHFAVIYGYGFKGSWTDLPGVVIFDIRHREIVYFDTAIGISASMAQLVADGIMGVMDCMLCNSYIVPLFGQIGHTSPPLSLDGDACSWRDSDGESFIYAIDIVNNSDGYITGGSTGNAITFPPGYLGRQYGGSFSVVPMVVTDNEIKTARDWNYIEAHPELADTIQHVQYVGTVKGIIQCDNNAIPGHEDEGGHTSCYFVWGSFSSIGGVSCSRCAFLTFYRSGSTGALVNYDCEVTVPDIDSDPNWPELSSDWSVTPQLSTLDDAGNEIAADYSAFLVCGCTSGGPRRFVTGVWYATSYDETLVGGHEIPHMGVMGYAPGYGGFFPATISTEDTSVPITDAAAGLRACFGRFRTDALVPVPNVTTQIGAAFCVSWKECQLKASGVRIASWQIACAALVVPFACPEWGAKSVTFDWSGWTGARTSGSRFHVWIARGRFTVAPAEIARHGVWGKGSASGLEYVGELDPTGETTSATLAFARPLDEEVATLIVTASVSMDAVNPSESPTLPMGVSTLLVNMADASVENASTAFMPDITLY